MKHLAVSKHFQRQLKKLSQQDQQKVTHALKRFISFLKEGKFSEGLGFKKINHDKYEIRVGIRTRIVMKEEGDLLVCHVVGDHEEVRRYLREYRNE